ncbi:MAG: hypothetical protein K6G43_04170 [Lachnospiraceae bacterium]|jgi:uncharacterized membrane protein YczE|nr:hypothetical protein [Lachnospiraceae bacterium]
MGEKWYRTWAGYDRFKTDRKEFFSNLVMVVVAVLCMGISLSFLLETDLGTDPYTFMNVSITGKIHWTLGNWQLLFNTLMLIIVILITKLKLIGPGSIANMVLIGYTVDFCRWLIHRAGVPDDYFMGPVARPVTFIISLFAFLVSAAVYMNSRMGLSPYDGLGFIICTSTKKVPFFLLRIFFDSAAVLIGIIFGMLPNIGTILMALFLGPVITWIGKLMEKYIFKKSER